MPVCAEISGQGGTGPVVTVGTDSVPAPERFDWWCEMVGHEVMPVAARSAHTAVFQGRAEAVELPHSQVTAFDFSPMTARRSPVHIRRHDPENYYLLLVRDSSVRLEQARGVACLQAGDMALFSSSHPLACEFLDQGRQTRPTLMRLPRPVPPLASGRADRLLAEPLPSRAGSAALLGPYLAQLPQAARTAARRSWSGSAPSGWTWPQPCWRPGSDPRTPCPPRHAMRCCWPGSTPSSTSTWATPSYAPRPSPPTTTSPYAPSTCCSKASRKTVSARIRRRRLERCHADLTDPRPRRRSISAIAARWGFPRPADFSRAFRAAYGVTPRELRQASRARVASSSDPRKRRPSQDPSVHFSRKQGRSGPETTGTSRRSAYGGSSLTRRSRAAGPGPHLREGAARRKTPQRCSTSSRSSSGACPYQSSRSCPAVLFP
ncbi:helix-turn-helix domain-containing protein, partial [Streptomyces sp. MK37H]|uniref:AraC family transcriptional regulator n=1 Tax=Streptomyces sp. MK37H TaxID=2699117 RepID=UPI0027E4E909